MHLQTSVIQRSKALNITEQASSERSRIQIQQHLVPGLPCRPFKLSYATAYFFQASWPWHRQALLDTSHSGRPGAGSVTTMSWHLRLPPQPCELYSISLRLQLLEIGKLPVSFTASTLGKHAWILNSQIAPPSILSSCSFPFFFSSIFHLSRNKLNCSSTVWLCFTLN